MLGQAASLAARGRLTGGIAHPPSNKRTSMEPPDRVAEAVAYAATPGCVDDENLCGVERLAWSGLRR